MTSKLSYNNLIKKTPLLFAVVIFLLIFTSNIKPSSVEFQHHALIAQSFLEGKTYFLEMPGSWHDTVLYEGKHYWPEGPFPSLVLLPFVYLFALFGAFFYQGYLQFVLSILVYWVFYKISRKLEYAPEDAHYWAFAFCFGSAFIGVALITWSYYLSHVITVLLVALFLLEYLSDRRPLLLGLFVGCLILTRPNASFIILLPVLPILFSDDHLVQKVRYLSKLFFPSVIGLGLLFFYNYIRFGTLIEQGYLTALVGDVHSAARDYGMLSLTQVPGNLYHFLLASPLPVFRDGMTHVLAFPFIKGDPWGMSIFITSPMFLFLFLFRYKGVLSRYLWLTIASIALPIFLYYGVGYIQFGYRYSLDFLPLLFLLLLIKYKKNRLTISFRMRNLILFTSVSNLYLLIASSL